MQLLMGLWAGPVGGGPWAGLWVRAMDVGGVQAGLWPGGRGRAGGGLRVGLGVGAEPASCTGAICPSQDLGSPSRRL